jgi:hypothetical protein
MNTFLAPCGTSRHILRRNTRLPEHRAIAAIEAFGLMESSTNDRQLHRYFISLGILYASLAK